MIRIMFVCHGNICRSPMAEFVMKHLIKQNGLSNEYSINSAATSTEEIGNGMHRGTRQKLTEENIPYTEHRAVQLNRADYEKYDYIIAMDSMNLRWIERIVGADRDNKVFRLLDFTEASRDVADPWYTGDFNATFRDVNKGCVALLKMTETKRRQV